MICASLTAMGMLSNAGPKPSHLASPELKQLCREAAEYCKVFIESYYCCICPISHTFHNLLTDSVFIVCVYGGGEV